MHTMRIGVRNAVKQLNTSKTDVETNYTMIIVAEFGTKKKKSYVLSSPEAFLSLKRGNLLRPLLQSSMKNVSMIDTATQTDLITILNSAVQSNTTNTNSKTEEQQNQKGQINTTNRRQTKTPIEEKKKTHQKTGWPEKKPPWK